MQVCQNSKYIEIFLGWKVLFLKSWNNFLKCDVICYMKYEVSPTSLVQILKKRGCFFFFFYHRRFSHIQVLSWLWRGNPSALEWVQITVPHFFLWNKILVHSETWWEDFSLGSSPIYAAQLNPSAGVLLQKPQSSTWKTGKAPRS